MGEFDLVLESATGLRLARYRPEAGTLVWAEDGTALVTPAARPASFAPHAATSPEEPAAKSRAPRRIKLQLGLSCNFSCQYCSQSSQRPENKSEIQLSVERVDAFLAALSSWFDGGDDGQGEGVVWEFWGGETLIYWRVLATLADALTARYPHIRLALFTNGSLLRPSMAADFARWRMHVVISHDGARFTEDRGRDPLLDEGQRAAIAAVFKALAPARLISFNATLSWQNYSLRAIRRFIADKLAVEEAEVRLTWDLATPYDEAGKRYVASPDMARRLVNELFFEWQSSFPHDLELGDLGQELQRFFTGLAEQRPVSTLAQKCGMDRPEALALDLTGAVLTCQNVAAEKGHQIGEVKKLSEVRLSTAYHFTQRAECQRCPLVALCRGACMFLTGDLWQLACQQHFIWNSAKLALALFLQTQHRLVVIRAPQGVRFADTLEVGVLFPQGERA